MRLGPPLPRSFFDRSCLEVARDLVGACFVHRLPDRTRLVGRLVEVEAYLGEGCDPASHAHPGRRVRNRAMFGPPGRLYAYRSYGIHTCVNVVCEAPGRGAAVLLRALEPIEGLDAMRRARGLPAGAPLRLVAAGPGRLAQAMHISLEDDGRCALGSGLSFRRSGGGGEVTVERSPRIGITRAAELPYRFCLAGSPWLSRRGGGDGGSDRHAKGRPPA